MIPVKVGLFDIESHATIAEAEKACRILASATTEKRVRVSHEGIIYQLKYHRWSKSTGVFTATMWRVRTKNLPSGWKDGKRNKVPTDLAEGASFAYCPKLHEALIQYNHHGPRHRLVGQFLEKIGISGPVLVHPKLQSGLLAKLRHGKKVGRFEFALGDVTDDTPLRGAGVGAAIDQMNAIYGTAIRVSISLRRTEKQPDTVKRSVVELAESLLNLAGVRGLKAWYKKTEDHRMEMLDLLKAHRVINLEIDESGRELNHADCRNKLRYAIANQDNKKTSTNPDGSK